VVYPLIGSVLGQPQMLHVDLLRIVVVVSLTNVVLAIPAMRLVNWSLPASSVEGVPTSPLSGGPLR
jgi:ABC-type multidrug transport system permease subunit